MSRRLLVATTALVALGLTACGSGTPTSEVSSGAGTQGGNGVALPTLPGADERHPQLYDDAGCARTSDGSDCSTRAADLDAALAGMGEADWRVLAGFVGSRWTTDLQGGVTVLADTVTTGANADGVWVGRGLVRNNATTEVAGVVVQATLLDGAGHELATVAAPVTVPTVRAGEPVAFELTADDLLSVPAATPAPSPTTTTAPTTVPASTAPPLATTTTAVPITTTRPSASTVPSASAEPATTVAPSTTIAPPPSTTAVPSTTLLPSTTAGPSTTAAVETSTTIPGTTMVLASEVTEVRWEVITAGSPTAPTPRDLELGVLWQRGLADPRPVDMYLFRDPTDGALPLVVFGGATAVGSGPIANVSVLGAWVDATGRVLDVATATVARPDSVGSARPPAPSLDSGETADLVFTVDAASAPAGLDDAQLMLWGWGS